MKMTLVRVALLLAAGLTALACPVTADTDTTTSTTTAANAEFRSRYRSVNLFQAALEQTRDNMDKERDDYEDALRRYGPDNDATRSAKKRAEIAEKDYLRILKRADKATESILSDLKKG